MWKYISSYFNNDNNYKIIKICPSDKFFYGLTYMNIMENNNEPFIFTSSMNLHKVEFIPEFDKNTIIPENLPKFTLCLENFNISPSRNSTLEIKYNSYNKVFDQLITHYEHNIIIRNEKTYNNFIPKFHINLYISMREPNNHDNSYINLNSFIYKNTIEPPILLKNKKNVGICFSGGGPRAFACTLGYLRALRYYNHDNNLNNYINILKEIKYISGVSGSTWAIIPYIYLNKDITDSEFLGYNFMGNLNKKIDINIANYEGNNYLGNSISKYASNSQLLYYIYEAFEYLDYRERSRIWSYIVGQIFLKPYGLLDTKLIGPNKEYIKEILNKSPLNVESKFNCMRDDVPYYFINATVVDPNKKGSLVNTDFKPFIFTPVYSGMKSKLEKDKIKYGGNYIDTYGFHPYSILKLPKKYGEKMASVEIPIAHSLNDIHRFNLFDMMGASSSAFSIITEKIGLGKLNPSYRLYNEEEEKVEYFDFADGGTLDNLGILPMLQKKVKHIVLFINSDNPLRKNMNLEEMNKEIDIFLRQLFLGKCKQDQLQYFGYFTFQCDCKVFKNRENNDWINLLKNLKNNIDKNGVGFAELYNVETLENKEYGIPNYIIDRLSIVYLYDLENWRKNRCGDDVDILLSTDKFKHFPYYNTVFENCNWFNEEVLQIEQSKINLLSDMCYWSIQKEPLIRKLFNEIIFNKDY